MNAAQCIGSFGFVDVARNQMLHLLFQLRANLTLQFSCHVPLSSMPFNGLRGQIHNADLQAVSEHGQSVGSADP